MSKQDKSEIQADILTDLPVGEGQADGINGGIQGADETREIKRLHDMRHFFASLLLAQGVELKTVSDLLGHASIQITADTYAHLLPKVKEQAIDILDDVLTGTK